MLLVVIRSKGFINKKKIPYLHKKNLKSGTDRVYEAFLKINNRHNYHY